MSGSFVLTSLEGWPPAAGISSTRSNRQLKRHRRWSHRDRIWEQGESRRLEARYPRTCAGRKESATSDLDATGAPGCGGVGRRPRRRGSWRAARSVMRGVGRRQTPGDGMGGDDADRSTLLEDQDLTLAVGVSPDRTSNGWSEGSAWATRSSGIAISDRGRGFRSGGTRRIWGDRWHQTRRVLRRAWRGPR